VYDGADISAVLHTWRTWAPRLPEETTTSFAILRAPNAPEVPEPLRGRLTVHIRFAHLGTDLEAELLLQPIRAAAPALIDDVHRRPYTEADAIHQDPVEPVPFLEAGGLLSDLSAESLDALIAAAGPGVDVPLILVEIRLLGGQLSRQPKHPNAVPGRDAAFNLLMIGVGVPALASVTRAAFDRVLDAVASDLTGNHLPNMIGSTIDPAEIANTWPAATLQRLREVKRAWDPDNVFRLGHVVPVAPIPSPRS
jgi:hypothetical protein